jgi:hypothetical protein
MMRRWTITLATQDVAEEDATHGGDIEHEQEE